MTTDVKLPGTWFNNVSFGLSSFTAPSPPPPPLLLPLIFALSLRPSWIWISRRPGKREGKRVKYGNMRIWWRIKEIQMSRLSHSADCMYLYDEMKGINSKYNGIIKHKQTWIYALHHIYIYNSGRSFNSIVFSSNHGISLLLVHSGLVSFHYSRLVAQKISTPKHIKQLNTHTQYAACISTTAPTTNVSGSREKLI